MGEVGGETGRYCETFEDGIPSHFRASRPESLSLCPWHYKQGSQSLQWDWSGGDDLVIHHGIGDVLRVGGFGDKASFSVWLYMENPLPGTLMFEFRDGETVTGFFRFPMAFTGWRQARPYFGNFPNDSPTSQVDNIRIAAPAAAEGTVFLDFVKYNTLTYGNNSIDPEAAAGWRSPVPDEGRFPTPDSVTEAEAAAIQSLLGPDEGAGVEDALVNDILVRVASTGIVRDEHGVRGPGIDAYYQYYPSAKEQAALGEGYWSDEHGPNWLGVQTPVPLSELGREVAGTYRASNDAAQREQLAEAFLLIADHLQDQALQAGSGFKWNWWVGGSWADALFLMRELLAETGRLRSHLDFQLYTYGADALFAEGDPPSNMDFYHLNVPSLYRLCLMQGEATEQVRWLNAFSAMLDRSMLQPTSSLKIDGSAYHHQGHYHSYAQNAFGSLPPLFERLMGTPWQVSAEARERLRLAVLAQRIYCNRLHLPLSQTGRSPFKSGYGFITPRGLEGMAALANCGSPDGTEEIDREVAAAYLRLVPEAAGKEPYRSLGIEPEAEPTGTFVMPYAALLCHRREDWLASVHGQSRYVWGTERQDHHNRYGLFQGLGQLEILAGGSPVSAEGSGRRHAGWCWARYEGTTVPQVTTDMLEEGGRGKGHSFSAETTVGGLSHRGRQGVFTMVVNQPMPGEKTLTARKSWFLSDDHIVCLGSDIACDEDQYPTQTTLCQKGLCADQSGRPQATTIDGENIDAFPEERELGRDIPHWFLDVQQTGFYVPRGQKLTVARRHQESRDSWDEGDTEGDFLTSWIDHGKDPKAGSYEYAMVVRADPQAMERFVSEPSYEVIQKDRHAHIVRHTASGRWSCAFFAEQGVDPYTAGDEPLPVAAVDRPCLVAVEPEREGRIHLSVTDPDLNLVDGVNQPRSLRITLRGAWHLEEATGTVCAWQLPVACDDVRILSECAAETVLEIVCRHGASYDITLVS